MTDHASRDSIFQSFSLQDFGLRFRKSAYALVGWTAFAGALLAVPALAQTAPPVVISQVTKLGTISGGPLDGGQPAGTSIGVTTTGNFILDNTYGDTVYEINGTTGVVTTLGSSVKIGGYDPGPITVDSANNIYIAGSNGSTIVKVPVLSGGGYPAFTSSPPACTSSSTVECTLSALSASYIYGGYSSLAFDPSGNFYFVTGYNSYSSGSLAQNGAIWKCSAACLAGAANGTAGTATILFTNPQTSSGTLIVGALTVDSLGDIYYTDSDYNPVGNDSNEYSSFSELKELPAGASSATTLYTFTPGTVGNYDDEIDAVAVDSSNTVYFATQSTGTFAMLTTAGVAKPSTIYGVSPQGAKALTTNGTGTFYGDDNTGSGDFGYSLSVGLVTATATTVGTPSTTTGISAVLNSGVTCGDAPTTMVTSSATAFSATVGTCATTGLINSPYIPLTVTFSPTVPGTQTTTLTATSNGSGTATATGAATGGTVATPTFNPAAGTYSGSQTVTISDTTGGATIYYTLNGTSPTTSSTVYTAPVSVTSTETFNAIAAYSGSANSLVATAAYTIQNLTAQTITFTQPTSPVQYGVAPITLSATASSGLTVTFTVTSGPATVSGNTLTITGTGTVVVTATQAGNGTYAAATPVSRTIVVNASSASAPPVVISQVTKLGAISGSPLDGGQPAGTSIGVTSTGNVIVDNTYGNTVYEINGTTGAITTLGTLNNAGPIAVDSANNIYITSQYGSTITKVPALSGGAYPAFTSSPPACTSSSMVECTLAALSSTYIYGGYSSIAFDPSGNFYFVTGYNTYSSASIAQNGAIWKCSASCLAGAANGTAGNAAIVYTNPQPTDGSLKIVGGLAVDSLGDIYYTDADYNPSSNTGNLESSYSELKELAVGGSSATTLYTYTSATPLTTYNDMLDAVAVDSFNTVYFATQNEGTYAMLSTNGVANPATLYAVSPQGAKVLTTNRNGNFYGDNYFTSSDAAFSLNVGLVTATATTVGTPSTTTGVSAVLNNGSTCMNATTPTVTSSTTEYNATAGTCTTAAISGSASVSAPVFPLTVTFTPADPGPRTATLTATSGGTGTATATGVATGGTVPTPTFTPAAGNYSVAQSVTINDATVGATIYYTLNGTMPTTSSTVYTAPIAVAASETIEAIATYSGSTTSAVGSAAYTITTQTAQTITFTQPATPVQYGVAPITLSATASSGLAVTFTVTSGPATVSGNTLTITGAGTVVVTASQAGNGTYAAATPVSRTIVVNGGSAQLIIFPALANYTHGSTVPLIAASTSGLAVTFTATGPATVNGNGTLTITGTGTVTVTAAQAGNTNFEAATSVSQSFTAQ